MTSVGGISVRNFYDSLVDTEVEERDEDPVIAVEVDGLCRDLQNVALDKGQNYLYLRGEVVRQPLGEMGITMDARFLATEEGKTVVQVARGSYLGLMRQCGIRQINGLAEVHAWVSRWLLCYLGVQKVSMSYGFGQKVNESMRFFFR